MSQQPQNIKERIKAKAFELLGEYPQGLHYAELLTKIHAAHPTFNNNTIGGSIWNLAQAYPEKVYKPSRGLFRLLAFEDETSAESAVPVIPPPAQKKIVEDAFYAPFADWLKNEVEDVSHAIPLGGNIFKDKWGTPDVIGKKQSKHSDIIKGPTEIVSAEIKTDTGQLITAFGQACAYKLFSHKAYLVVPRQAHGDEISRLDSLCQIFGIGLVTFDVMAPDTPDFRILVRPSKHDPDLFYTNQYMAKIEKDLFS
jgi:hypothetical protein